MYPNKSLIKGPAKFTANRTIAVNGNSYTPGKIILATGSSPWAPPIPGLHETGFLDSTDALDLLQLPQSMIVIGGGAIGLELAQLFNRSGVRVTVLEAFPRIAPSEEPEIGDALARYFEEEKMTVRSGLKINSVAKADGEYRVECEIDDRKVTFAAEQLLVATGRRPNTADLETENAGITTGTKGEVIVDEFLRTTNPDVYAAGDCIGDPMFVYVAAYGGGLAAENALTGAGRVYDLRALPRVTFTDPQIASVGYTEQQARAAGIQVKTTTLTLKDVPRALAARDTRGLIKLIADAETDRLVGAHVLATEGGEVIQEATLAIRFGLKVADIAETFHPYLTMAEGLKLAALTFSKEVAKLSCCAT
jgi:mercuric reductase